MLKSFREKPGHHQTTPGRLPIQAPGQGIGGKQQSESNLAWAPAAHGGARSSQRLFTSDCEGESHPSLLTCCERE